MIKNTVLMLVCPIVIVACSGDPRPLQEAIEASELGLTGLVIESGLSPLVGQNLITIDRGQIVRFSFKGVNSNNQTLSIENVNRRWSVSDSHVASITDTGVLTGLNNGQVAVGLRLGGVVAPSVELTVSDAQLSSIASIEGDASLLECSKSSAYTAVGSFTDGTTRTLDGLVWRLLSGSSGRLLDSGSTEAVVGALAPGTVTLIADRDGVTGQKIITIDQGLTTLSIEPETIEVERSADRPIAARAEHTTTADPPVVSVQDVTALVTWSIDGQSSIASVSNAENTEGTLRGLALGSTNLVATCGDSTASSAVTVVLPVNIVRLDIDPNDDPIELTLSLGAQQLEVTAVSAAGSQEIVTNSASWRVESGTDVISIDNSGTSRGTITPLKVGEASIEVSYNNSDQKVDVVVR